jgi:hypothetical protein
VITVRLDKNQGRHRNAAGTDDLPPRPTACSFGWWLMAGAGLF